jgi:adenylate cyclase
MALICFLLYSIGDAYVIVAGFPFLDDEVQKRHKMNRRPDAADHANNMVRMAMDMLGIIKRVPTAEGSGVQMRLGIHTGEVIAGCIGTKQLRYDIWGNDCLVANSMESNGIPSGVVVSYSTAELIRSKYRLVRREPVVIKNKKYDNYAVQSPIDQPEKRLRTKYDEAAEAAEEGIY